MLLVKLTKLLQVSHNLKNQNETLCFFLQETSDLAIFFAGAENEKASIVNQQKLEKKFGQSSVFVASTLLEYGGILKSASPASLLKEAIHVIGCGYEDKTDWGKDVSLHLVYFYMLVELSKLIFTY